jgi:CheY-like chemotaxis protein
MNKRCIIIDNEDQSEIIEKLIRDGKAKGIHIEVEQFNVGSTFENDLLSAGAIDIDKVVAEYKKRYRGQSFHLAAFDWDLSDPKIDGIELMRLLIHNKILRNTPKLLYSGLLEDKLSAKLDDYKNNQITKQDLLKRIKTLINADIKGFVARDNYDRDIISTLEGAEEVIDLIIEEELNKLPDVIFSNSFSNDNFNGKSYKEIAQMLEEHVHLRNDFKKEIVQQVIAYLTAKI